MGRSHALRGVLLTANLPQLQNLIKRDPAAYKEEFLQQWTHYMSIRNIFELNPEEQSQRFKEMVAFITQVAQCYPKETADFPNQLTSLLSEKFDILNLDTKKALISSLLSLRKKSMIKSAELLACYFPLLARTKSSSLKKFLQDVILSDIQVANLKAKSHNLNRMVQSMLFQIIERGMESRGNEKKQSSHSKIVDDNQKLADDAAIWAITLVRDLWRKGIWEDAKTVSIISYACFHPSVKVQSAAMHFFMESDKEIAIDDDGDDYNTELRSLQHRNEINKKSRGHERKIVRQLKSSKKRSARKNNVKSHFSALQLLHDPQTFAEKLSEQLERCDRTFPLDHRILTMRILTQTMGSNKLCVLSFYSYVLKYIKYQQLQVPSILLCLVQSVHELTPPDVLAPPIRKIAQEFVHPGVGNEVVVVGLNSIREICRRQPWCMDTDLLEDLIAYRKSRDKGIMSASRGLLQLFRERNPELLRRRERGKDVNTKESSRIRPFGHQAEIPETIEGLDLLENYLATCQTESVWDEWEVNDDSDSSSESSDGWIDVSSDEEEDVYISDSDDGDERKIEENAIGAGVSLTAAQKSSNLAVSKILTPADFALMNELRLKHTQDDDLNKGVKRKLPSAQNKSPSQATNSPLFEEDILGPRKKVKADYEERLASIKKGREGRPTFGSGMGKKNKQTPSSSTNREKARNKPIMMILSSGQVRSKKKASLRDKQKKLRAHIERAKKSHH